jgi:hypothetical protein
VKGYTDKDKLVFKKAKNIFLADGRQSRRDTIDDPGDTVNDTINDTIRDTVKDIELRNLLNFDEWLI